MYIILKLEDHKQPPQEVQFQTWHNSFTLMLDDPDSTILIEEGTNPFANNGQGAFLFGQHILQHLIVVIIV